MNSVRRLVGTLPAPDHGVARVNRSTSRVNWVVDRKEGVPPPK